MSEQPFLVMPGLGPGIHVFARDKEVVDGRNKSGHDVGLGGAASARP